MGLDAAAVLAALPPEVDERQVHVLDVTGSTNDDARALAVAGAPHGTIIIADEQTRGRGRSGASWVSPPGSGIWMSMIARFPISTRVGGWIPLAVGIAAAEAVGSRCGLTVGVKWPNDLWIEDRKLGGILVESSTQGDRFEWVVAGIGVNVNGAPAADDGGVPATSVIDEIGRPAPIDRERLAGAIVSRVFDRLARLHGAGDRRPDELQVAFRERDVLRGREVSVTDDKGRSWGRADGTDEDGALRIRTTDGERVIRTGSVRPRSWDERPD